MASMVSTVPRDRDRISPALTRAVSGAPTCPRDAKGPRSEPDPDRVALDHRHGLARAGSPRAVPHGHALVVEQRLCALPGKRPRHVAWRDAQPGGAVSLQLDEHRAQRRVGRALLDVGGASTGRGQCPDCGHRRSFRAIKACNDASARLVVRSHLVVDVSMQGRGLTRGPDDVPDRDAVGLDELRRVGSRKRRRVLLRGQACRQANEHDRRECGPWIS